MRCAWTVDADTQVPLIRAACPSSPCRWQGLRWLSPKVRFDPTGGLWARWSGLSGLHAQRLILGPALADLVSGVRDAIGWIKMTREIPAALVR